MKKLTILVASLAITSINTVLGQASPTAASASAAPAARTEVYHVNFSHAAVGKAGALEDALKKASANAPMPGHVLVKVAYAGVNGPDRRGHRRSTRRNDAADDGLARRHLRQWPALG